MQATTQINRPFTSSENYGHSVIALIAIAICLIVGLYNYHNNHIRLLKQDFQAHSHASAVDAAHGIAFNMRMLHEDLEMISRLLSGYDFGSYHTGIKRKAINPYHDEAIKEIYRSMNTRTDVSELYVIPAGFDPDRKDPVTNLPQIPIITYDSIIKSTQEENTTEGVEEIEIHEYRVMKHQLDWFSKNKPVLIAGDKENYPSLSSGEVITCDNRFINASAIDDTQRSGIVYSMPIYNKNGVLTGMLSSVILTRALQRWLPDENFALSNKDAGYIVLPGNSHAIHPYLDSIRKMETDDALIYSEVISVDKDWAGWSAWVGVSNSVFLESDAVRLHYTIIIMAAIISSIMLLAAFIYTRYQYAKNIMLNDMVRERTIELQKEIESHKLTETSLANAKKGLEMLLKGRTEELEKKEKTLIEAVMEKELTEIKALDRESFIAAIFNTVVDGIISINDKGIIQSCNKSAVDIFGYKQKELIGRNISMLMPEPYSSSHDGYLGLYMQTGESNIIGIGRELVGKKKDGSIFPIELGVGRLNMDGGIMFVGIIKDITERKNIENELVRTRDTALQSSRVKSEFIANISHEIRTPMNGILGFLQLLNDSGLSSEQKEYADIITDSANGLMTIVNDIFDYSRIESGKINIESSEFDIRNTIESIITFFSQRAKSQGLDICHKLDARIPDIVVGSPGRLRQVLVNLINNAIKFTSEGEVSVKATVIEEGVSETVIMLEVCDTGPGINIMDQRKIFQSFVQADGSSTREHGGLGLGLAISRQLVEVMGGEIGVHSTPGEGSTFWFTLAFRKAGREDAGEFLVEELEQLSVLIIDDDHISRDLHRQSLRESGIKCHSVSNALVAMQEMHDAIQKGRPYDVILIDIRNPNMDWVDVVKTIRKNPLIEDIHIVVLCSVGQRGHGEVAQEYNVAVYLARPFTEEQVIDALSLSLGRRRTGDSSLVTLHTLSEIRKHEAYRILVVEDKESARNLLKKAFADIGYHPDIVKSGEEALTAAKKEVYDIIFMDIHLPGIDGIEATRLIKMSGEHKNTPVIALCSSMPEEGRQTGFDAGLNDFIAKPVIADVLQEKIRLWIDQKDRKEEATG